MNRTKLTPGEVSIQIQSLISELDLTPLEQTRITRYREWVQSFPGYQGGQESIFNPSPTNVSVPVCYDQELYRIYRTQENKGLRNKIQDILQAINPEKGLFYAIGICSHHGDGGGQVSLGLPVDILSMIAGALYTAKKLGIKNVTCLIGDDIALGNPLFRDNNGGQRAVNGTCLYYRAFIKAFVQQLNVDGVEHKIISGADYRDDQKYKEVYRKAAQLIKPEDIGFEIHDSEARSVDYYRRQVAAIYHLTVSNNIGIKLSWTSGAKNALDERAFDLAQNLFSQKLFDEFGDEPHPLDYIYVNPGKTWHLSKNRFGQPTILADVMPYCLLTAQGGFEDRFAINGSYTACELYKSHILPRFKVDGEICWPETEKNPQLRGQPKDKHLLSMMHQYAALYKIINELSEGDIANISPANENLGQEADLYIKQQIEKIHAISRYATPAEMRARANMDAADYDVSKSLGWQPGRHSLHRAASNDIS